jgi:AraC-like DNA-binding protein
MRHAALGHHRGVILGSMPDLPPRPATAANACFRAAFYSRWGRENALVCGTTCAAEYAPHPQTLSVKAAWGGGERYLLGRREVVVDDDHWLVLNEQRTYGSVLRSARPVTSFALFFRPGLAQQVAAQRAQRLAAQLDTPDPAPQRLEFSEHLRAHGDTVSRHLRAMALQVRDGERSEDWLEEQALLLADELIGVAPEAAQPAPRRSPRSELLRRLRLAADFIDSSHAEPITLDDMARVACLSRYHFVRHFRALHGITPYAYLLRKRAQVARRLLVAGAADREAVALACGFANRFALARALRRHAGDTRDA